MVDPEGEWTYQELWHFSGVLARHFQEVGLAAAENCGRCPRPIAVFLPPGRVWYSACVAAWRLGIPVVPLVDDLSKPEQQRRAERAFAELLPQAVLGAPSTPLASADCCSLSLEQLLSILQSDADAVPPVPSAPIAEDTMLCYVYTGGTTQHSKCVAVTHGMAIWEVENYQIALRGRASNRDRMLQYSSPYWGAAIFGQMDLALAFGACNVICQAPQPEDIAATCVRFGVTVLGIVPSQLRAWQGPNAKPLSLRLLITWAERTPPKLAREWSRELAVVELLIASEYWLSFYSDCATWTDPTDGTEQHILHPLPSLDFKVLKDGVEVEPGDCGELHLSGSTVFAGYVDEFGSIHGPFVDVQGKRYFPTQDRLKRLEEGGYACLGRADSLVKVGGAYRDLATFEAQVGQLPGVAQAAIVAENEGALVAYLELDDTRDASGAVTGSQPLKRIEEQAMQTLLGLGISQLRLWSSLPLRPVTSKVDRQALREDVSERQAREAKWNRELQMVQRRMVKGYAAWHVFVLVLAVAVGRLQGNWKMIFWRLLKLPYLWTAFLFVWHQLGKPRHKWVVFHMPLGPPDMFLLLALLTPNVLLRPLILMCLATISWLRDRDAISASGFLSLCLTGAWEWKSSQRSGNHLASAILLGLLSRYVWFLPSRLRFLLALPLAYVFSFPKWCRDEFLSRSTWDASYLRRWILRRLPVLDKPPFDASLRFNKYDVAYDWGSENRWVNVCMNSRHGGNLSILSFWEPVRPAVLAPASRTPAGIPAGTPAPNGGQGPAEGGLAGALALLVTRVGGEAPQLALDSLQAIRFAELARYELGLRVSPALVLRCRDVTSLARALEEEGQQEQDEPELPDEEGAYRLYMMEFGKAPVDWYVRYGGAEHLDLAALQRAVDRLVQRHSALRTTLSPDAAVREAMDRAAGMWQLICSSYGSSSPLWTVAGRIVEPILLGAWPRTLLKPDTRVQIDLPLHSDVVKDPEERLSDDDYMFKHSATLRNKQRSPFHIFVYPLVRSGIKLASDLPLEQAVRQLAPSDVTWYIYTGITHSYSDGASGNGLLQDLLRLYAEEAGRAGPGGVGAAPPEPMALLQRRLKASLRGRLPGQTPKANDDVYHEILCEDWGRRPGFEKKVRLDESVFEALQTAAKDVLGCSADVAWLTAVVGSLLRLFPSEQRVALILKCACRDGPDQNTMVGFLSEQRVISIDCGDNRRATLLDIACRLEHARRNRAWRAPQPYEAAICVYVNIVGSVTDGLPLGCSQVCRQTGGSSGSTDAWAHLNLRIDQLSLNRWDFRIIHWDKAWGWHWGDYFISVLGAVIADMAECPLVPLVPAPTPPWRVLRMQGEQAAAKRKEPPEGEMNALSGNGPKAMRIEEADANMSP